MNEKIKLLITFAIVILLLISALMMTLKEISVLNLGIIGINKIKEKSNIVDSAIVEIKNLKNENFETAKNEMEEEAKKLITAKKEYLDYINLSDDEQLIKASNEEKFTIEFLWTTIGNYATKNGVNVKFEILKDSSKEGYYNISFSVEGEYSKIIDYIFEIEEDEKLSFTIENFKLIKESENLVASFMVNSIKIDEKTMNSNVSESTNTNNTETNTINTDNSETNTTNTNNTVANTDNTQASGVTNNTNPTNEQQNSAS